MLGLALEGGGAKGAFHMGAVKAFLDEGYVFNSVAGTSIGAINGAIIAQGDFELGYRWWERMDTSLLFDIEKACIEKYMNKKTNKEALQFWGSVAKNMIGNRGLDTKKIRNMLQLIVNEEKLRSSGTDFGIVTVSVSDWKPLELFKEDIPQGKMIDYLMASANFPAFRIEPIEGKYYIDGGFYDSCPINLLSRKGYKDIIAIRTFGMGRIRKVKDEQIRVTSVFPSEDLGKILIFDHNLIRENLKMGYCDAMRLIKGLKGRKYYIHSIDDDSIIFKCLLSMPNKAISDIGALMCLPQMDSKKMLFERIIPNLSRMLGLPDTSGYEEIIIGALEQMAERRGIEKYMVRSFSSFLWDVKKAKHQENDPDDAEIQSHQAAAKTSRKLLKMRIIDKAGEELLKVLRL